MILVNQLDKSTSELGEVVVDEIGQFFAGEHSLFLKYADISPGIDDSRLNIPQCSVAKEIGIVVKKAGRSYDLSVAYAVDFHHLCRFGAQQKHKAVLFFFVTGPLTLGTGHDREARQNDESGEYYVAEQSHRPL
jgi:hypothetical protein